jgi:hypothetical protein
MSQSSPNSVLALTGFPPLIKNVPSNWTTSPAPDKISLLWNANYKEIYHKFSPYTNYNYNILGGLLSNQQPFVYTYIDESNNQLLSSLPSAAQSALSMININQDTINDTVRVSKFLISSWGVQFLASQILIQRLQPFDETRIYNPLSPLLATVQPMSIGLLDRSTRHIETSVAGLIGAVGLGGLVSSIGLGGTLGIGKYTTPSSTAGDGALSTYNSGQGKGLIRGGDATTAQGNLSTAFPAPAVPGGLGSSIVGGIISSLKSAVIQIFGGTSKQPTGTIFRADETAYGMMALSPRLDVSQLWYPNPTTQTNQLAKTTTLLSKINNTISTVMSIASNPTSLIGAGLSSLFPSTTGNHYSTFTRTKFYAVPGGFLSVNVSKGYSGLSIKGRDTGYTIDNANKYSNVMGMTNQSSGGPLMQSDMLVQFSYYASPNYDYDSKFTDPLSPDDKVGRISKTFKKVINGINDQKNYLVSTNVYSKLLSSGNIDSIGYDNLFDIPEKNTNPMSPGVIKTSDEYKSERYNLGKGPSSLDKRINANKNLKFSTTFTSDGLNQLSVLKSNNNGTIPIPKDYLLNGSNGSYTNWKEYKPYEDDLIAFHFYDVVNQKYIPFRATVKSISEGNTAFWDELRFLGRADQLYSYNGFSRTLSFSFNIVINSITELLPSWTKINYLASSVKPSNYTRSDTVGTVYNKFIVPPMFMVTIGDLYRFQPIVLRSITVNIPEDALWETLNEYNSDEWSYLNGIITSTGIGNGYGQLPREVEISVEGALLEKERAQVGGSHFGHAPRVDDWETTVDSNGDLTDNSFNVGTSNTDSSMYMPKPSYLHKQMISPNPSAEPVTK